MLEVIIFLFSHNAFNPSVEKSSPNICTTLSSAVTLNAEELKILLSNTVRFLPEISKSSSYSHNPERQVGKPLLPVLRTLVCCGRGSNPRPLAQ